MAKDRNIIININDVSPLANTAYVDAGKDNKTYNKAQVNELVEDLREGTLGSISPSQTLQQLNAMANGNYYASEAGNYAFGVNVPVGWQFRFNKTGTTWKVLTKVEMKMQDLTSLENRITTAENKVDDFIDNFAVEVDQEFDVNSENAQSGVSISDKFLEKKVIKSGNVVNVTPSKILDLKYYKIDGSITASSLYNFYFFSISDSNLIRTKIDSDNNRKTLFLFDSNFNLLGNRLDFFTNTGGIGSEVVVEKDFLKSSIVNPNTAYIGFACLATYNDFQVTQTNSNNSLYNNVINKDLLKSINNVENNLIVKGFPRRSYSNLGVISVNDNYNTLFFSAQNVEIFTKRIDTSLNINIHLFSDDMTFISMITKVGISVNNGVSVIIDNYSDLKEIYPNLKYFSFASAIGFKDFYAIPLGSSLNYGNKLKSNKYNYGGKYYNLLDYLDGIETNGEADVSVQLQSLVDKLEVEKGGVIYVPAGKYKLNNAIMVKDYTHIIGDGMKETIFIPNGNISAFRNEKLSAKINKHITFKDIGVDGSKIGNSGGSLKAFNMTYIDDVLFRNIHVFDTAATGWGCDMIFGGVLDNIIVERCGRIEVSGCSGIGIGVGAQLKGREPIQVINCKAIDNYNYGIFFEWHNHSENGELVIGDFPYGIQVSNCYAEGNSVGFGASGGNGILFNNCISYRNYVAGFANDHGTVSGAIRYSKNVVFNGCISSENGNDVGSIVGSHDLDYGYGYGFVVYSTSNQAYGTRLIGCTSEGNVNDGLYIRGKSSNFVNDVQVDGGSFLKNGRNGIYFYNGNLNNVQVRGAIIRNNIGNGIDINGSITDGIIKDNIIKNNAVGINKSTSSVLTDVLIKDNIVKNNTTNLNNITQQ